MLFVRCRGGISHNPAEFASVVRHGARDRGADPLHRAIPAEPEHRQSRAAISRERRMRRRCRPAGAAARRSGSARRKRVSVATVSASGTVEPGVSLTTSALIARSRRRKHVEAGQRVAEAAEIAAGHQQRPGCSSAAIQSSTVWLSSSGTMTPPMPSISSVPLARAMASRQKSHQRVEVDARGSRAAPPCRATAARQSARARCARSRRS